MKAQSNILSSPYAQVLSLTSFRSLWFGQVCSQFAGNSLLFVLALRVYQTTGSNTAVSGLFLAYGIPAVLFGMVAGTAVDHLDKRRVLMLCDIARAILSLALLFLSDNVASVYIITFLNAVIGQFYVPAEAPLIPRLVKDSLLVSANSLFSFTFYSSLAVGTILAGPFLRWFGPQGIFVFIAALFVLASWNVSRVASQAQGVYGFSQVLRFDVRRLISKIVTNLLDGVRYVSKSPSLSESLTLLTGTQIIFALLGTLGPGFADRVLGIDVRDASLYIVGPAVLGIIAGALWVGTVGFRFSSLRLIRTGVLGAGIVLLVIALSVHVHRAAFFSTVLGGNLLLPIEILLFFLLGVANSLLDVPANSMLQSEAHGSMRGRVYGILAAFVGGVGILPVVIGGVLADAVGVGKVLFILGLVILLYGMLRMRYNRAIT